jgi:hypothetical protein
MSYPAATAFEPTQDRATPAIGVGDVLERSLRLIAARWPLYGGLFLGAEIAHRGLIALLDFGLSPWRAHVDFPDTPLLMIASAVTFVLASQDVAGPSLSVGDALARALRRAPALAGMIILQGLAAVVGLLLFVVPGLVVLCAYAVAGPVCVVEGLGPIESLSRSAVLTRGNGWRVFGVLALLYGGAAAIDALVVAITTSLAGDGATTLVSPPLEIAFAAVAAVTTAVLYARLRAAREGVTIAQCAAVFD